MTEHYRDEVLSALLDNELESGLRQGIERHIETCPDCRRALDELGAIRSAAMGLEQLEPSEATWAAIRQRVRPVRRVRPFWVWAGAASAAAVALVAVLVVGRPSPTRLPAPDGFATMATAETDVSDGLGAEYGNYLRGIDEALDEIREAMSENPGNPRVRMALYRAHSSKASALDHLTSGGY